GVWIRTPTA
nr:Chain C, GLY-VAL-TRP-ILE-ARG-THR-PRO-THR-ALA [Homo sapiens]